MTRTELLKAAKTGDITITTAAGGNAMYVIDAVSTSTMVQLAAVRGKDGVLRFRTYSSGPVPCTRWTAVEKWTICFAARIAELTNAVETAQTAGTASKEISTMDSKDNDVVMVNVAVEAEGTGTAAVKVVKAIVADGKKVAKGQTLETIRVAPGIDPQDYIGKTMSQVWGMNMQAFRKSAPKKASTGTAKASKVAKADTVYYCAKDDEYFTKATSWDKATHLCPFCKRYGSKTTLAEVPAIIHVATDEAATEVVADEVALADTFSVPAKKVTAKKVTAKKLNEVVAAS